MSCREVIRACIHIYIYAYVYTHIHLSLYIYIHVPACSFFVVCFCVFAPAVSKAAEDTVEAVADVHTCGGKYCPVLKMKCSGPAILDCFGNPWRLMGLRNYLYLS